MLYPIIWFDIVQWGKLSQFRQQLVPTEHFDWTRGTSAGITAQRSFTLCIPAPHRCTNHLFTPNLALHWSPKGLCNQGRGSHVINITGPSPVCVWGGKLDMDLWPSPTPYKWWYFLSCVNTWLRYGSVLHFRTCLAVLWVKMEMDTTEDTLWTYACISTARMRDMSKHVQQGFLQFCWS